MHVDLFSAIHKAIRTLLFETGMKLQTANLMEPRERMQLIEDIERVVAMLHEHAVHEDEFIFPVIEQAAPGSTQVAEAQHGEYDQKEQSLVSVMAQLKEVKDVAMVVDLSRTLLHHYMDFVAFYLMHLNTEEQTCLPASRQVSAEELLKVRVRVQQDTAPQRYQEWLGFLFPSLSSEELLPLLRQAQVSAPKPIWEQMLQVGSQRVDKNRWAQLLENLNAQ